MNEPPKDVNPKKEVAWMNIKKLLVSLNASAEVIQQLKDRFFAGESIDIPKK